MIFIRPTFHLYQLLLERARLMKEPKFKDDGTPHRSPIIIGVYQDDADFKKSSRARMKQRHWLSDYL